MASDASTTSSALPPRPSASWTPAPSNMHTLLSRSTVAPPSPRWGYTRARRGCAVAPPSSPPPNQDMPMPSPSPSPPRSSGPRAAPMWMRTDFPTSKRAHCKEAERRARSGAKHEGQAAAAPPHHTPSREVGSRARVFDPDSRDEENGHSIEQEPQALLFWAPRSSGDARRAYFSPVVDHCISLV
ncbi:hypothetical protein C8F04DRAFT_1274447 [Mycena alexandri]|uniref:Uncharacterized protein n=1 Tax=Mycena alexandri TaxID=1745969 RepID=A0AAD6S436_9AGAR|nr:hypothetical protein C8F04DRAFT_1274447 [Mycena alexandri]